MTGRPLRAGRFSGASTAATRASSAVDAVEPLAPCKHIASYQPVLAPGLLAAMGALTGRVRCADPREVIVRFEPQLEKRCTLRCSHREPEADDLDRALAEFAVAQG